MRTQRVQLVVMSVVAALLGLVAGLALVLVDGGSDAGDERPAAASMADVTLSESPSAVADTASEAPSVDRSASEAPSIDRSASEAPTQADAPGDDTDDALAADARLDACVDAVARADAAVAAARTALGNWKTHYGAQLALDRGAIDGDEAKRRWATSKAPAIENLDALAAARDALPDDEPCSGVADAQSRAAQRRLARTCAARMTAAPDVMSAADPSLRGWRDHLEMMATKDEYPIEQYLQIWRRAVDAAPGPMRAFERAADAYAQLEPCDRRQAMAGQPGGPTRGDAAAPTAVVVVATGGVGTIEASGRTPSSTQPGGVALRCRIPEGTDTA